MLLHRAIKDQGIEFFSFEVIKKVECIDDQHFLIFESCCMDKYDSIRNGYNTKHSIDMKLYDYLKIKGETGYTLSKINDFLKSLEVNQVLTKRRGDISL